MGEITERLPKAQYDQPEPKIKRTNSMPTGLAEADLKAMADKKKPDFIRSSVNGNISQDPSTHKSQSALLELPHKAMIMRNRASAKEEEDSNSSRALMKKAHELHNISKSESKKSEGMSIANRA